MSETRPRIFNNEGDEIGGDSGGDASHLEYPVRFEVDWVRVYQRQ